MTSFKKFQKLFDSDKIQELSESAAGLLWLKLKSVSRKQLLNELQEFAGLSKSPDKVGEKFFAIFNELSSDIEKSDELINRFIRDRSEIYSEKELESVASELHKMQSFSWGGDYNNALDKFLVNQYVKKINSYDGIVEQLKTQIPLAVEGYVLCSWYNHWSTILIESVFRMHERVLPAIGQVKKVDFFIDDFPFDLKTTYLPVNFIEQKRKELELSSELAVLREIAEKHGIPYDKKGGAKNIAYEIAERIRMNGNNQSKVRLSELWNFRKQLLRECQRDPTPLIQNLYEQQGSMRFDSTNRLFVVLADMSDFDNSWKLKRNPALLRKSIHAYLDSFSRNNVRRINFQHKEKSGSFSALSDVICIVTGE